MKGKNNVFADALSRKPAHHLLTDLDFSWLESTFVGRIFQKHICLWAIGWQHPGWSVQSDGRHYLLESESKLKQKILKEVHDSPMARHLGFLKTYRSFRERFSWKGLKGDVMKYVRECAICQHDKSEHTLLVGLLQPLPIPEHKWESILMDFITGLPKVNGKDCICVVVDQVTKYTHFFTIPSYF